MVSPAFQFPSALAYAFTDCGYGAIPRATSLLIDRDSASLSTNPFSASSAAGPATSRQGPLPHFLGPSARARTVPGPPGARHPVLVRVRTILPAESRYMVFVDLSGAFSR